MLSDQQTNMVWQKMAEAEVRSLYFGDLAATYTKRKQFIAGATFFLSSGAAASLWATRADIAHWAPLVMSLIVAVLSAYSMAVNLDRKAVTMANLHAAWNHLADDYEHLWHHWHEHDAQQVLDKLLARAREISETATTEAPYDKRRMDKWQEHVYSRYSPTAA